MVRDVVPVRALFPSHGCHPYDCRVRDVYLEERVLISCAARSRHVHARVGHPQAPQVYLFATLARLIECRWAGVERENTIWAGKV